MRQTWSRIWVRLRRVGSWVQQHPAQILGVFVVVLTLATGVQSLRSENSDRRARESDRRATEAVAGAQHEIARVVDCLTTYSNGVADAIEVRSKSTEAANDAELAVFQALFTLAPTPDSQAQARRLFNDYLTTQLQAQQNRRDHPYPDPPRDVCR